MSPPPLPSPSLHGPSTLFLTFAPSHLDLHTPPPLAQVEDLEAELAAVRSEEVEGAVSPEAEAELKVRCVRQTSSIADLV